MSAHFAALDIAQAAHCSLVGLQAVSNNLLDLPVTLQRLPQKAQSRRFVAGFGDLTFQHLTLVVHRPPEIVHLAVDPDVDFVNVPAPMPETVHPADPLAADVSRKQWSEPVPPKPNRLVTKIGPTLEQQVFHIAQG
jgi:hypothetical protein